MKKTIHLKKMVHKKKLKIYKINSLKMTKVQFILRLGLDGRVVKFALNPIPTMHGENGQLVIDQPTKSDTQPVEVEYLRIFYRLKN